MEPQTAARTPLDGAWHTQTYIVQGTPTTVEGVLLFAGRQWSTLYFVPGPFPEGPWASAEAGTFEVDGDRLVFHHRFQFQGGGGRALQINQAAVRHEVCRVVLEESQLMIRFPSGNTLVCGRGGV